MGQQQLLLLVLGIVIVGIAVVAGIQAFSEGKEKAEHDAAVSDAMRIISDVQAWSLKPAAFGGGAGSTSGATFAKLGMDLGSHEHYQTLNGCFSLADGTGDDGPGVTLTIKRPTGTDIGGVASCSGDVIASVGITEATTGGIKWDYDGGTE